MGRYGELITRFYTLSWVLEFHHSGVIISRILGVLKFIDQQKLMSFFKRKNTLYFTLVLLTIILSSCSNGNLEIQVDKNYQGPVAVIEQNGKKNNQIVKIDSIGIGTYNMNLDKMFIQVVDINGSRLKTYDPSEKRKSKNEKMVFDLGESTINGYCSGSDVNYIYFYVGTFTSYKKFCSEYNHDELLFFKKKNIAFCDYAHGK